MSAPAELWINKKASELLYRQRVRTPGRKKVFICSCPLRDKDDRVCRDDVVIQNTQGHGSIERLSPNCRVMIPLSEDPILSGWKPEA